MVWALCSCKLSCRHDKAPSQRVMDRYLLIAWIISHSLASVYISGVHAQSSVLEECPDAVSLPNSCVWRNRVAEPEPLVIQGELDAEKGNLPVVLVAESSNVDTGQSSTAVPGFALSLIRLVLGNVSVSPPNTPEVPVLWPLEMFSALAVRLNMSDVRMVVSTEVFGSYVRFFSSARPAAVHHTDQQSFLHIASWAGDSTTLHSVTLLTSPCSTQDTQASFTATAQPAELQNRCAAATVSNATLLPTLLQRASVSTQQPLLVLLASNVSLGVGLKPGEVSIRRPVVVVGLYSISTSIDFGMVTSQLNVTERYAKMYWQSVILENVAPGDALSAVVAPPFSTSISANIWAIYCNRSNECINLHNTTTVVATELERDYITYMFSMFNSPLPSLRQTTDFYRTDLKFEYIELSPGPGDDAITVHRLKALAWYWVNNIITFEPQVAEKLPIPAGVSVHIQQTRAGPLAQAVHDCSSLQGAVTYAKENNISQARLVIWMLTGNVTLNPPDRPNCWQNANITHQTQLFGEQLSDQAALGGGAVRLHQGVASSDGAAILGSAQQVAGEYTLGFGYIPAALQLPGDAADRFLQLHNVTLHQLPQGPGRKGAIAGHDDDAVVDSDVWTVLLWSIQRTLRGTPLWLSYVQLVVPAPEYEYLRAKTQSASSFAVTFTGGSTLLVTGASAADNLLSFDSFQGPGVSGSNIWVSADPSAAGAMPGYVFPLSGSDVAAAAASQSRLSTGGRAAIGIGVGAGGLLLLSGLALWWQRRRHKHQLSDRASQKAVTDQLGSYSTGGFTEGSRQSGSPSAVVPVADAPGDSVLDVDQLLLHKDGLRSVRVPAAGAVAGQVAGVSCPAVVAACSPQESNSSNLPVAPDPRTASMDASGDTVQDGLQRWRAAINNTTLQFMERRMGASHMYGRSGTSSKQSSSSRVTQPATPVASSSFGGDLRAASPGRIKTTRMGSATTAAAGAGPSMSVGNLQLQNLIGQGSFGSVYLGTWHGKRVAVKVMQLPAAALLGDHSSSSATAAQLKQRTNSPPHMAIMETVVSSTMSHPNVVQVYTYMLNPLTVDKGSAAQRGSDDGSGGDQDLVKPGSLSGWELRLVMEFCDQGTLRDALNHKMMLRGTRSPYLQPSIVLGLAHDVAAAMLHLHNEGVIHGDLKAANVLLTKGGEDLGNIWAATVGFRVTAKVADFGMAMPLDPNDTHATMAARGTPTHMSPELFMSGHVSKASDVYAYGILLYEIITGQRAYAGVPIPLLPHEVARQGLRPTWPANLSGGHRCLQQLAEACWAQRPQDRPSFLHIFTYLESCLHGTPATHLLSQQGSAELQSVSGANISSPRSPVAEVVDQQLQELKNSAERQLRMVQQQQGSGEKEGKVLPVAAAVVNRGEIAWSEVTCGGHFQRAAEEQVQRQQAPVQSESPANTLATKTPRAADMAWSEVSYGQF